MKKKTKIYENFFKRILDIILSFFGLLFLFPIYIILSILIRMKLGSPVIFKQERPGKKEKIFTLYKFRTMTDERDKQGNLLPDEIRLTKFGKFLRSTSLDELPELINIFKGDMSIVGPRPLLVKYLNRYNDYQKQRHLVRPGLTGLSQVSGRNLISWEEKFNLDVEYVNNISFYNDIKILFKTIYHIFKRTGISSETSATNEEFCSPVNKENSMSELISVVVPIYNISDYVEECIVSIINQTYTNLEVILVNDGSTDNSVEICKHYVKLDRRLVLITKPNGGLVSARKAGLVKAKGKYICCVDGDDWVDVTYVENMYKEILATNSDVVISGFKRDLDGVSVDICNKFPDGTYSNEKIVNELSEHFINYSPFFDFGIYSYLWNKLFKRELLLKYQMDVPDEIFIGEDSACVYPLVLNAKSITINSNCDYNYRQRPNSMLKKIPESNNEFYAFEILYKYLCKSIRVKNNEKINESLSKQIDDLLIGLMIIRFGGYIKFDNEIVYSMFDNLNSKHNIAIYSAGTFGQHLYRRLKTEFNLHQLFWFDQDYKEYQKHDLNVQNPKDIYKENYDYIYIASLSKTYIDTIKNNLRLLGYKENQLLSIFDFYIDKNQILEIL